MRARSDTDTEFCMVVVDFSILFGGGAERRSGEQRENQYGAPWRRNEQRTVRERSTVIHFGTCCYSGSAFRTGAASTAALSFTNDFMRKSSACVNLIKIAIAVNLPRRSAPDAWKTSSKCEYGRLSARAHRTPLFMMANQFVPHVCRRSNGDIRMNKENVPRTRWNRQRLADNANNLDIGGSE